MTQAMPNRCRVVIDPQLLTTNVLPFAKLHGLSVTQAVNKLLAEVTRIPSEEQDGRTRTGN